MGRITSIHGVLLPPKKQKSNTGRYITLRFVLTGTIPSKKNMIWADNNLSFMIPRLYAMPVVKKCVDYLREHLRSFIRNSKKYTDWLELAKIELVKQAGAELTRYEKHGLVYPLSGVTVKVYHYWADNKERDLTNKLDTINDLLVSCGIIANDNWQVLGKIESSGDLYRGEILAQITTIDVTWHQK